MTKRISSVAMTSSVATSLVAHLMRRDGQEDLCMALYRPSTGRTRDTALIAEAFLPLPGEREVHGIVTFTGDYVMRIAQIAAKHQCGLAIIHSHPSGSGWQGLSSADTDAESTYARMVYEVTGLRLLGMTYAGLSNTWSARFWDTSQLTPAHCVSVRVVGEHFSFSWNESLLGAQRETARLTSTMSCWGPATQTTLARMKVLIAGLGTLGLDIGARLAAAGVGQLGLIDFDDLELKNLDRLREADAWDVLLGRSKLEHAEGVINRSATCPNFQVYMFEGSVADDSAQPFILDYDLIVCAIDDHPWPRAILTALPYSDLIPVIDGGVAVDVFEDCEQMRNATWRSHVIRPGRPCMACNGQIELGNVSADREGVWRSADYINGLPKAQQMPGRNVTTIATGAVGGYLAQFTSFIANPSNLGEPGPVRFSLSTHWLERLKQTSRSDCLIEAQLTLGDQRFSLSGVDHHARERIAARQSRVSSPWIKSLRWLGNQLNALRQILIAYAERRLTPPEQPY